jgi:hypothetical protein
MFRPGEDLLVKITPFEEKFYGFPSLEVSEARDVTISYQDRVSVSHHISQVFL